MKTPHELRQEIALLKVVFSRNRNQQKAQIWWKYFSIFIRRVSQLSTHKRLDIAFAKYVHNQLVPQLWRALHSALAQGAFLTISFAVMAGVARISALLAPAVQKPRGLTISEKEETEDLGEVIRLEDPVVNEKTPRKTVETTPDLMQDLSLVLKTQKTKSFNRDSTISKQLEPTGTKTKKKHKTKKKLDAIDAIFG